VLVEELSRPDIHCLVVRRVLLDIIDFHAKNRSTDQQKDEQSVDALAQVECTRFILSSESFSPSLRRMNNAPEGTLKN